MLGCERKQLGGCEEIVTGAQPLGVGGEIPGFPGSSQATIGERKDDAGLTGSTRRSAEISNQSGVIHIESRAKRSGESGAEA